jgi:hypothetical protein
MTFHDLRFLGEERTLDLGVRMKRAHQWGSWSDPLDKDTLSIGGGGRGGEEAK